MKLRKQSILLVALLQSCRGSAQGSVKYGNPQYSGGNGNGAFDGVSDGS
jgi:hypothetical protein